MGQNENFLWNKFSSEIFHILVTCRILISVNVQKYSKESAATWIDHSHQVKIDGEKRNYPNQELTLPDVA